MRIAGQRHKIYKLGTSTPQKSAEAMTGVVETLEDGGKTYRVLTNYDSTFTLDTTKSIKVTINAEEITLGAGETTKSGTLFDIKILDVGNKKIGVVSKGKNVLETAITNGLIENNSISKNLNIYKVYDHCGNFYEGYEYSNIKQIDTVEDIIITVKKTGGSDETVKLGNGVFYGETGSFAIQILDIYKTRIGIISKDKKTLETTLEYVKIKASYKSIQPFAAVNSFNLSISRGSAESKEIGQGDVAYINRYYQDIDISLDMEKRDELTNFYSNPNNIKAPIYIEFHVGLKMVANELHSEKIKGYFILDSSGTKLDTSGLQTESLSFKLACADGQVALFEWGDLQYNTLTE